MAKSRREFLKLIGAAGVVGTVPSGGTQASSGGEPAPDCWGMLTDLTLCIGCRKCEFACREANQLPNEPIDAFEDKSVMDKRRRPDAENVTVVNRCEQRQQDANPVYVKTQCMHCNEPACASACPVAAIRKTPEGPVIYEASLCMGCRYCMMACPFSIPAYTYDNPLTPVVRKCTMCYQDVKEKGTAPACARMCPVEAITFGRRDQLLALAREKIQAHPDRYVDQVYGEHEVGGTSWLYLAPRPFAELGFRTDLGTREYPKLTAGFLSLVPLIVTIWPVVLLGAYALTGRRTHAAPTTPEHQPDPQPSSPSHQDSHSPSKGA